MKKFLLLAIVITCSISAANNSLNYKQLENSRQLIVITTDGYKGKLQMFNRKKNENNWRETSPAIPVMIGKNGLIDAANKRENDHKTPAGIYSIGSAFGFGPGYIKNIHLPYIQLAPQSVCVNDPNSQFYNNIVNTEKIKNPDWKHVEQMRQMPQYLWGITINYNQPHPVPGAGSCLAFHIWQNKNKGTAGGIAMSEPNMEDLITWINPNKKPYVIIISKTQFAMLKKNVTLIAKNSQVEKNG